MALQFVGGTSATGTVSGYTVNLNGTLTGGIASSPSPGDIVIVFSGFGDTAASAPAITGNNFGAYSLLPGTTTYHQNDTHDTEFGAFYAVMGATVDTSLTVTRSTNVGYGGATVVQVWRGQAASPFDVAAVAAGAGNDGLIDPAAVTPVTAGAVIIAGGAATQLTNGSAFVKPANMTGPSISVHSDGTTSDTGVCMTAHTWTTGAFNPDAVTGGSTDNTCSWRAMTLVLAPGAAPVSATLSATEAGADTAAVSADVLVAGDLSTTEAGADTFAASGEVVSKWILTNVPWDSVLGKFNTAYTTLNENNWKIASGYQLEQAQLLRAGYPLAAAGASARHNWCTPDMDYKVRLAFPGGKGPFLIEILSGPAAAYLGTGGTRQEFTRTLSGVPDVYIHSLPTDYAVLTLPKENIVESQVYNFTVRVTDQTLATVTYNISATADSTKFIWFSGSGADGNPGTKASPKRTLAHGYNLANTADSIFVFEDGTYSVDDGASGNITLNSTHCRSYIGLPSTEGAVVFDFSVASFTGAPTDAYFEGIKFSGSKATDSDPRLFNMSNVTTRMTFWRCIMDNRKGVAGGTPNGDNPACVFFPDVGTSVHDYIMFLDCVIASTCTATAFVYFSVQNFLEENCYTQGSPVIGDTVANSWRGSLVSHIKGRNKNGTVRFCDYRADSGNGIFWVSNQNPEDSHDVEVNFCRFENLETDGDANGYGISRWNGQVFGGGQLRPSGMFIGRCSLKAGPVTPIEAENYVGGDDIEYSGLVFSSTATNSIDSTGATSLTVSSVELSDVDTLTVSDLGIRGCVIASTLVT